MQENIALDIQRDTRKLLQNEIEKSKRQSHDRCLALSSKLQAKNQEALYKFKKFILPSVKTRSQAIQNVIDTKLATDIVFELYVEEEDDQLKFLLESTITQLKVIQETESQKLSMIREIEFEQSCIAQQNLTKDLR